VAEISDLDLLAKLDVPLAPKKVPVRTPREERIIAGFEDIQRFVAEHARVPQHGETRAIFERIYAVRLDRLRASGECRAALAGLDDGGLLLAPGVEEPAADFDLDDAALLSELAPDFNATSDITQLQHVRSREEVHAAEEIANRTRCEDFDRFKPLFAQVETDLQSGLREARRFGKDAAIETGDMFILGGQMAYVAETGEAIRAPNGESDARLRVIYGNETESNLLRRSLQRALYKDETGRRITAPDAGPLFGNTTVGDDLESGTIYVLRSRSDHPEVAAHRKLIHKIGVTGAERVEDRIANAGNDATYLLAGVDVVATYKLYNINRVRLEKLLHRVFASARLNLMIEDRFGRPVKPQEWFLVPLPIINQVVEKIRDQSITEFEYDPQTASLRQTETTTSVQT